MQIKLVCKAYFQILIQISLFKNLVDKRFISVAKETFFGLYYYT